MKQIQFDYNIEKLGEYDLRKHLGRVTVILHKLNNEKMLQSLTLAERKVLQEQVETLYLNVISEVHRHREDNMVKYGVGYTYDIEDINRVYGRFKRRIESLHKRSGVNVWVRGYYRLRAYLGLDYKMKDYRKVDGRTYREYC